VTMRQYTQGAELGVVTMKSVYNILGNERGMVLTETFVMLLVVSLILVAVPASLRSGAQMWEKSNRHNEILQNALIGMEELTRELSQAKEIIAVSPADVSHGFIEFRYYHDIDGDGDTVDNTVDKKREFKYQRYEYNGSDDYLQHAWSNNAGPDYTGPNLSGNLNPLAGPVDGLTFTCYKELGQPITLPDELDQVRVIHIKMTTYDDQGKVNSIPLSTRVYLRTWIMKKMAEDFAIFGDDGVSLGAQPLIVGYNVDPSNVGANEDIYIDNHTTVNGEIHHGSGGALIAQTTDVNLGPDYGFDEIILMPCVSDFSDPQWWGGGAPPASQGKIKVNNGDRIPIPPGVYGDLELNNNATLDLVAGTYWFSSITAKNRVSLNLDVTGGDITVFVDGVVDLGNRLGNGEFEAAIVGGGPESVYFETHHVQDYTDDSDFAWGMGNNTVWFGAVYAPYGNIEVTDGVIAGQLISGGTVEVHGGSPSQVTTPVNATMVDFALANHIRDHGSKCLGE